MRLVNAYDLLKKAKGYRQQTFRGRKYTAAVDVEDIMDAPTVTPQPTRCRCKHCGKVVNE